MAQLSNLIVNGVSRLLSKLYVSDSVTAPEFIGKLTGNADSATKVNGHTVNSDVPANAKFTDTTYTHPTTSGNKHIPSGGSSGQILRWSADGTAAWGADNNTTYSVATTSANGLMSSTDKSKLDGIATGATKVTVDSSLSSTSTNPVQNKVVNSALASKAASNHNHNGVSVNPAAIELTPASTSAGHGGYIDFHYNASTEDYTSRIIEGSSGTLTLTGKMVGTNYTDYTTPRFRNIYAGTSAMTAGTTALSNGAIYLQYES